MRRRLAALLGAAVLVLPAMAGDYTLGNLTISHPWSRATAPSTAT